MTEPLIKVAQFRALIERGSTESWTKKELSIQLSNFIYLSLAGERDDRVKRTREIIEAGRLL